MRQFAVTFILLIGFLKAFQSQAASLYPIYPQQDFICVDPDDPVLIEAHPPAPHAPMIEVTSAAGTLWPGAVVSPNGGRTWSFKPQVPYPSGERMRVQVRGNGTAFTYSFVVTPGLTIAQQEIIDRADARGSDRTLLSDRIRSRRSMAGQSTVSSVADLPSDFPTFHLTRTGEVEPGYLYMVAFYGANASARIHYAIVMDDTGKVVFFRTLPGVWDETFEPFDDSRRILQMDLNHGQFLLLDTTLTVKATYKAQGANTDFHDARLLPNGNLILIAYRDRVMDLTNIGGPATARVRESIIQELTPGGDLVRYWRSLDHQDEIPISDVRDSVILTWAVVDYMHTNSIQVDTDGNLILSHRNLSEVNKIHWGGPEHGKVMWRLWGKHPTLVLTNRDEDRRISAQHDARRLPDGKVMMFDNGSFSFPYYARVVAYTINEADSTATMAWQKDENKQYPSSSRGSSQLLPGGGILASWGIHPYGNPTAIEWNASGGVVAELYFDKVGDNEVTTYRVRKSTMLPKPVATQLMGETFGNGYRLYFCKFNDPDVAGYRIILTDPNQAVQTRVVDNATSLLLSDLWPSGTWTAKAVALNSSGNAVGDTSATLTFEYVTSSAAEPSATAPGTPLLLDVWPNPFNGIARFTVYLASPDQIGWRLYNNLGRRVLSRPSRNLSPGPHPFRVNLSGFPSGVYFLKISSVRQGTATRKIVLIR